MSVEDAFGDIRLRVSKILGIKTAHHVILHPSGTDAELTALLAGVNQARQLGCSGVVNIVVGAKEVGSNTATAAGGKHFSKHFPVSSTNNPEDEAAQGGNMFSPVAVSANGIENGIQVVEIAARLDDGSMVPNFDALVLQTMENATLSCKSSGESGPFFVLHVVDGSKLGSHITSRSLLKRITCQYGDRVLFVLDACQARTSTGELDWYLARNAVVLMTASKFYGAPGFCAAALVPHKIAMAGLFIDTEPREPGRPAVVSHNLGKYITKLEVPRDLEALRATLPARPENVGLLLRWSCGVFEMDRFAKAGQKGQQVIAWWVDGVRAVVRSKRPHVLLLRDTGCEKDETVPFPAADTFVGCVNSIVSFCVITGASKGDGTPVKAPSTMSAVDLRRFHRWLTIDMEGVLPEAATDDERRTARLRCFIGQPVDLGKLAVLRLAISASLASDLADGSRRLDEVLADDGRVLDKILLVKKYYGEFCAWDAGEL
ncbi:uncharacterized protein SPSK_01138 [Sporothrix schenckii 1099-18]|uniref:Uncharacterized protein n=1 Tax=Sporothrix schenckii 1099-18 TaxID=1397361 RepID=A0A0F2LZ58_SPOSC|nr:uncharacterized protein SPSK_01138 [Sporothrix schenckii 1099-18]KJR81176.1 hypothetical protein SPSK_01138 [Sporothrix schenckii 1099-18]